MLGGGLGEVTKVTDFPPVPARSDRDMRAQKKAKPKPLKILQKHKCHFDCECSDRQLTEIASVEKMTEKKKGRKLRKQRTSRRM